VHYLTPKQEFTSQVPPLWRALGSNIFTELMDHGTAVASLAVGDSLGTNSRPTLMDIRVDTSSIGSCFDGLQMVRDMVSFMPGRTKSVINMLWGGPA
jgi:hypothetical protein